MGVFQGREGVGRVGGERKGEVGLGGGVGGGEEGEEMEVGEREKLEE